MHALTTPSVSGARLRGKRGNPMPQLNSPRTKLGKTDYALIAGLVAIWLVSTAAFLGGKI